MEIEQLYANKQLAKWNPNNQRHLLFLAIKYPETEFYRGSWGPELLHFVDDGPYRGKVGKIYCSYGRYTLIAKWFLEQMFNHE
jgi:hypothetical protein